MDYVGRKIPPHYENPIDNIIIDFCEYINPYLVNMKITPNIITTLSLIFGIFACIMISRNRFLTGSICFIISYILDCMDGNMARAFNMVTQFGDWFDHISDFIKFAGLIFVIMTHVKISHPQKIIFLTGFIVFQITAAVHMGCQERIYNDNSNDSLSFSKKLCLIPEYIIYTRYFGVGTLISYIVIFLLYVSYFHFASYKN